MRSSDTLLSSGTGDDDVDPARRRFVLRVLPAAAAAVAIGDAALAAAADDDPFKPPAPPPADQPLTTIAFGACCKLDRPLAVWDAIAAQKPQLFLFLGDTIYKDTLDMAEKRAEYARLAAVPEFARFRKSIPMFATWDDHDYGQNDGGADYAKRDEAQRIFVDFFAQPDDPRRSRPGLYQSQTFGPPGKRTQILLLDTRYFRSPLKRNEELGGYRHNRDPAATMLGDAQWKWLAAELRKPADLRLICSSIPVLHEEQPNEKWDNLPLERAKLFKTIADAKANGVILLSGDRHRGEMSAADVGAGYKIFEVTSSGLNCPYEAYEEPNRHRIKDILWTDNFGVVRIDWSAADPKVTLEIRKGNGDAGVAQDVGLRALRA